ncbi:hypothetical protein [Agrobacterium tumefaciens]|uniref:hypothetical protein n=1 Tax=Agrobacterium tumefaciens TaxID=358 RepID=UPI001571FF70|nr:hypothetical protein [Agrobacterium tumefaciens]WCK01549.1 hypothetical protein G6L31_009830 [Agrobacterium tumefaciens]
MSLPKTKDEWIALGKTVLWSWGKLRLLFFVLGVAATLFTQLLTGFWPFRDSHQQVVLKQYEAAVAANDTFSRKIAKYNSMLDVADLSASTYPDDAQEYLTSLDTVSRLLPGTKENFARYKIAVANLNTYYRPQALPVRGTDEWLLFFGKFRIDYDKYMIARDDYLNQLTSELGGYVRYLQNS